MPKTGAGASPLMFIEPAKFIQMHVDIYWDHPVGADLVRDKPCLPAGVANVIADSTRSGIKVRSNEMVVLLTV
jgi:hypothetical protein